LINDLFNDLFLSLGNYVLTDIIIVGLLKSKKRRNGRKLWDENGRSGINSCSR